MDHPAPTLTWHEGTMLRAGEPWRLLAGSLHYFRVHPDQWRDRLRRLVDMGLNTVDTYIAWNLHQPREDEAPDFTGRGDLERFLALAADEGLSAIVRPGPYICAEWSNGALPVWLTGRGGPLRVADPRWLDPVGRWFDEVIGRLVPLQAVHGGPIVAFQVENEFGSYGDDPDYMPAMRDMLRDRGVSELLTTADGPTEAMVQPGAVPGALMALNLGSRADQARALHADARPGEPFVCGEFWNGWFDHWGEPHHVRGAAGAADTLADILQDGGGVSIYMAHGGTNFGTGAGANDVDGRLRATVTSYDSDAPIAEDGTLTEKFHALRAVLGRTEPIRSTQPTLLPATGVPVRAGVALSTVTGPGIPVTVPGTIDEHGIESHLVRMDTTVRLPAGEVELSLSDVRDRAHVYFDDRFLGSIEGAGSFTVRRSGPHTRLTVFAEVAARINYGPRLGEPKGLCGPVLVDGRRMVQRWRLTPVDLDGVPRHIDTTAGADASPQPRFLHADLPVAEPADAHLALPGFTRGFVWVGDFFLGRYDAVGPQRTLYVPAPLLQAGSTPITLLEWGRAGTDLQVRPGPELGPEQEYIEQF